MKVILKVDVKGKGKKGDTIEVSDGYGRNVLIAKDQAVEATAANINNLKLQKANAEKLEKQRYEEAVALGNKLKNHITKVGLKVGKDGKPFGSISNKDIAESLHKELGIDIDKKKIVINTPIKNIGKTSVKVKLHTKVTVTLNINVEEII